MDDAAPEEVAGPGPRIGNLLWHHLWTAALAANLVMPMSFAQGIAQGGEAGMALAVGSLWLLGDLAGVRWASLRLVLLKGAAIVALSQFVPVLQVSAGLLGMGVGGLDLGHHGGSDPGALPLPFRVFVATFVTGGLLLLACVIAGLIFSPVLLVRHLAGRSDPGESPPTTVGPRPLPPRDDAPPSRPPSESP